MTSAPLFRHAQTSTRTARTAARTGGDAHSSSEAGIHSSAKRWSTAVTIGGTIFGVSVFLAALPVLLVVALLATTFELLRWALGVDGDITLSEEGSDEDVLLVLPGTCAYVFWQLGMIQYMCERFDTRNVKLAGVSSGAISACFLLELEKAASCGPVSTAAERVRQRSQEIFEIVENYFMPILNWPMGFLARLGDGLQAVASDVMPTDMDVVNRRLRVGARRLSISPLPALVPQVLTQFDSPDDLANAILASSTVWLIVKAMPLTFVRQFGLWCSDGVNPFSFYCFWEYAVQCWNGVARTAAPGRTWQGFGLIYAAWNCGIMRAMLPARGTHIWVTPTVGGRLNALHAVRLSSWFIAEQWENGYKHAAELDAEGYWAPLKRRSLLGSPDDRVSGG